jgi:hypothetical protein
MSNHPFVSERASRLKYWAIVALETKGISRVKEVQVRRIHTGRKPMAIMLITVNTVKDRYFVASKFTGLAHIVQQEYSLCCIAQAMLKVDSVWYSNI